MRDVASVRRYTFEESAAWREGLSRSTVCAREVLTERVSRRGRWLLSVFDLLCTQVCMMGLNGESGDKEKAHGSVADKIVFLVKYWETKVRNPTRGKTKSCERDTDDLKATTQKSVRKRIGELLESKHQRSDSFTQKELTDLHSVAGKVEVGIPRWW